MFDDVADLYQQVILDHCKNPRNFRERPQCSCSAQGQNQGVGSCHTTSTMQTFQP